MPEPCSSSSGGRAPISRLSPTDPPAAEDSGRRRRMPASDLSWLVDGAGLITVPITIACAGSWIIASTFGVIWPSFLCVRVSSTSLSPQTTGEFEEGVPRALGQRPNGASPQWFGLCQPRSIPSKSLQQGVVTALCGKRESRDRAALEQTRNMVFMPAPFVRTSIRGVGQPGIRGSLSSIGYCLNRTSWATIMSLPTGAVRKPSPTMGVLGRAILGFVACKGHQHPCARRAGTRWVPPSTRPRHEPHIDATRPPS